MDEPTTYVSKGFLRIFALTGAWTILGAGIYLFIGQPSLAALLLIVVGVGLVVLALRGSSLKDGNFPRRRVILFVISGLSMLFMGLFLLIFAKGPILAIWIAYFTGIVILLVASVVQFTRSSRPELS